MPATFPFAYDDASPADSGAQNQINATQRLLKQQLIALLGLSAVTPVTFNAAPFGLNVAAGVADGTLSLLQRIRAANPFLRLVGTEVSGKDWQLVESAGSVLLQENTGTELAPVWATRFTFEPSATGRLLLPNQAAAVGVLDRQTATVSVVNTTVETDLYRFTVPAGSLGTNRALRLSLIGDILGDAISDTLAILVKYGVTTVFTYSTGSIAFGTTRTPLVVTGELQAKGATNAQVYAGLLHFGGTGFNADTGLAGNHASVGNALGVHNSVAEDSTVAKDVAVTAQWTTGSPGRLVRRLSVRLEVLP